MDQSQQVLEWQAIAEKRGEERGRAEGKAEAVLRLLELRFKTALPPELAAQVQTTTDLAQLDQWLDATLTSASLDEFCRWVLPQ